MADKTLNERVLDLEYRQGLTETAINSTLHEIALFREDFNKAMGEKVDLAVDNVKELFKRIPKVERDLKEIKGELRHAN